MTAARRQILQDVRRALPVDSPLPAIGGSWTQYNDPHRQFLDVLQAVGGVGKLVDGIEELRMELTSLATALAADAVCSTLPDCFTGNVDMPTVEDPHELAGVDLAILPGELAVAENAAVWVTDDLVRHRVAYFLSQHVAIVIPHDRIVSNMHLAYEWMHEQSSNGGPFGTARWGTFMSGPSKTADIEQALVIGAHGARSLHVYFVNSRNSGAT
jgi:L-lactate dehydrogenase complex protein LldG